MVNEETTKMVRQNWQAFDGQVKELSQGLDRMEELVAQLQTALGFLPIDTATRLLQDSFPKDRVRTLNDITLTLGRLSGDITVQRNRFEKVKQELQTTLGVLKAASRAMDKLTSG